MKNNNFKIDAIILCGGYGTRIQKYTKNKIPKSLIRIKKKFFLDYLLKKISIYPFNKIIIVAGFKGKKIFKEYNKKKINLIDIECVVEKKPNGTGAALNSIKKKIVNDFVLFNGDTFANCPIEKFFKKSLNKNFIGKIILTKNKSKSLTKNLLNLYINKDKEIYFSKKSPLINSGTIFLKKNIKKFLTKNISSFENDILKKLIIKKKIAGEIDNGFFVDIGTEKNLNYAKKMLPKIFYRPALFLDRDGVINKDFGYVHTKKKLSYNKKIFQIINNFQKKDYFIFIVTNQAGIAKGFYSLKQFIEFQKYIKKDLFKKNIYINDIEFCPHHPEAPIKKYKINCNCRKPKNGMIKNLKKKWHIDLNKSLFIGDNKTDYMCAKSLHIKFQYFNEIKNNLIN